MIESKCKTCAKYFKMEIFNSEACDAGEIQIRIECLASDIAFKSLRMTHYKDVDGKMVYSFRGIPIRKVDALIETEARVV